MDIPQITITVPLIHADYDTWEAWTESLPLWAKLALVILFVVLTVIAVYRSLD